jgi:hypothetical protein
MVQKATPLLGLFVLFGMLAGMLLAPTQAAQAKPPQVTGLSVPVAYTSADGSFVGTFDIDRFVSQGGELVAVGTLTGTATNTVTGVTEPVSQALTLDVISASGTCEILSLVLGPLDLDLLGLVVHLDQVVLTIDAESGPGNLLGNLLCGIAGLLDSGADAGALARLLNQLLAILG